MVTVVFRKGNTNSAPLQIAAGRSSERKIAYLCILKNIPTMIDEILAFNRRFVAEKGYERFITDKYPNKRIAIVTCMDTRLVELLPAALGFRNGDVKIIKNA